MPRKLARPLADPKVVASLLEKSRKGNSLGDFILFDAQRIQMAPEELRELMMRHGLEKWAPVEIRPKTAVRKALTRIRSTFEDGELRILVRKVVEDEDELIYALVGEERNDMNVELNYDTLNQVIFNKKTGELTFSQAAVPEIVDMYKLLCTTYTRRELVGSTRLVLEAYGAVILPNTNGMWFAPRAIRRVVEALKALYGEIDQQYGTAWFRAIGITDDKESREVVGIVMDAEILRGLERAQKRLDEVLAEPNTRPNAIHSAVAAFQEVKSKVEMYGGMLTTTVDQVDQLLTAASQRATAELMKRQEAKAA